MAEKKELNPSPKFPSGDYPKLSPNPNQREGLVNKTGEKPNTQFVNLPKEQEKRCLTVSEVIALIKKIAPQYGAENVKFTVDNIKSLTDAQCNDLKVGDMVAKKTGNQNHVYVVTYKEKNQGLCLTYADASVVETQSYDYTEGHWVYNSEDKTDFSSIGGLPEVTSADNEKVLEVIAGTWAKGRKKVSIIDAPLSTTLTDEQIEIISNGVFIIGTFLSQRNPVLFPTYAYEGLLIATRNVYLYKIDPVTKVISLDSNVGRLWFSSLGLRLYGVNQINEKDIPYYPADTTTGNLICRKGTLEWYIPVAVTGITSGDDLAGVQDNLVNAMKDHLDVEINGFRARYQYEENGYIVYSSMAEADSGVNLQVNMISLLIASPNTISFNQMKFAPVV